jgi:hypothetical protein
MECSCFIDDWGDDGCDVYRAKMKKARKKFECYECGADINPGDRYEHAKGLYDGNWFECHTCLLCVEIRDCFFCSFQHGHIWDGIREELDHGESDEFPLGFLDSISKEARDLFFEKVDLNELDEE